MIERSGYLSLRTKFEPSNIRLVIVAESPPASGKYFYDPAGSVGEPLFKALMLQIGCDPATKAIGLQAFQQHGWILVDATYEPVNELVEEARNRTILRHYPLLRDDLAALLPNRSIPIILIKANVCRLLEPRLAEDRFNVLNRGRVVYFPSHGQQPKFQQQFTAVLQ